MTASQKLPTGIRRHKSGGFIADMCISGRRKTKVCKTLEEAIIARKGLSAVVAQESDNANEWTLEQAISKTFTLVWAGKGSEATNFFNSQAAVKYFGAQTKLKGITLDKIDNYVEHLLEQGNSGGTVNRKLSCLSRILRTAHERGKLKSLPKMPRRREGTHRIRFLTRDEEERITSFLEHLGYHDHRDAVLMLIYTGFRCGELWRLERRDIDFEHNTITAWKTKNGHPRTIPIVGKIKPIIEERLKSTTGDTDRLFPAGSNPWMRGVWDKIRLHMRLDNDTQFVPHMLRHTCATRLAQKGLSMTVIKEWMGHSTIQTTSRYTHFAPKDLLNAARLLEE